MSTPKRLGKYRAFEATIELLLDYQVYFVAPSMFNDQLDSRPTMKQYTDAFDTADGLVPRRFQKARRLLWVYCVEKLPLTA